MAFNPLKHAFDDDGKPTPALNGFLDNALKVQRPVVLRWVKRLRAEHPDETPEQIAKRLERMYVRANTATGGVAGGAAMIPGIGTLASLGVSTVSVGGYLEMTALYAQAIAELHGVHTSDPVRTRSMVMALMLGEDGNALMGQLLANSSTSKNLGGKWGLLLGKSGADSKKFDIGHTIRSMFVKRFLARQTGAVLGRALPFGIGAVVGGGANLAMARQVIKASRDAFGDFPAQFPAGLTAGDRAGKIDGGTTVAQDPAVESGKDQKD